MPRRPYKKRSAQPDRIYNSFETAKLINYVMVDGKKTVAEKLIYAAYDQIKTQEENPLEVLNKAIANVAPNFEVKPKRVGGASYLVPSETRPSRRTFLALNWIIEAAKTRSNKEYKKFGKKLASELLDASKGLGDAVSKKKQVEKLAEANKAFAHFKW